MEGSPTSASTAGIGRARALRVVDEEEDDGQTTSPQEENQRYDHQ